MPAPMEEWSIPIEQAVTCTHASHVDGESCEDYGVGCHHACPCCMGTFFQVEVVETTVKMYAVSAKNRTDAISRVRAEDQVELMLISSTVQDWFVDEENIEEFIWKGNAR